MCQSACSANFSIATAQGGYPFPAVDKICRTTETRLKDKMRVGYRAPYLKNLAARMKKDRTWWNIENISENELRHYFGSIQGFGPYATNHILVLCGFYNQIPVDTVVKSYIKEYHHTEDSLDFIESCYEKWGGYRWWGMKLEMIASSANWLGD
jgi:3-methyladenine DNA glycosylase/8-oxoguanine DNA glycosylase